MTKKELQNKLQIVLSRSMINSFVEVTIPLGTTSLAINENYITDFVGLNSSKKLEYLSIDKNPIISFRGFPACPNLTYLSLIDTPISKLPNFRALAIAVAGQQLKTLNGIEVSTQDRASALAYGPTETICQLIIRGWLPKKPVSLPSRKVRNTPETINNAMQQSMKCRIIKMVDEQENDPISVRITRILRAQGYGIPQIREFLHDFFSPHTPKKKESKQSKEDSSIEAQIKKQQQIIDVLAAQLQALRSGNRTFNDYDEMIRTSGKNLLKNAEILKQSENEPDNNNTNSLYYNTVQSSEMSASTSKTKKKTNKPDYELLRSAVIDFLQVSENTRDNTLIKLLDSITFQPDQDEKYQYPEDQQQQQGYQDYGPQDYQSYGQPNNQDYGQQNYQNYGQQDYQGYGQPSNQEYRLQDYQDNNQQDNQDYQPQEQQNYRPENQDQIPNQGTNSQLNNNEFTEDEVLQLDDEIIPRPDTRNIIADMDEKEDDINSQIQVRTLIKEEEEEENEVKYSDKSDSSLNGTLDKGINVPENIIRNDNDSNKDEDVKKMLAKMDKIIFEDEDLEEEDIQILKEADNDSNQSTDDIQQSS